MANSCRGCGRRGNAGEAICTPCGGELEDVGDLVDGDDARASVVTLGAELVDIDLPAPELLRLESPIAAALGGMERAALVLVHGEPGAGKSTELARLANELQRAGGEAIVWLDAEMSPARYAAIFRRVGARATVPRVPFGPWRAVLALPVVRAASVVIVDSLDAWAKRDAEEMREALRALALRGALVLALRHINADGRAVGPREHAHMCDAEAAVTPTHVIGGPKCRWNLGRTVARPAPIEEPEPQVSPWQALGVREGDREAARCAWLRVAKLDHPDLWERTDPQAQRAARARFARARAAWEQIAG